MDFEKLAESEIILDFYPGKLVCLYPTVYHILLESVVPQSTIELITVPCEYHMYIYPPHIYVYPPQPVGSCCWRILY